MFKASSGIGFMPFYIAGYPNVEESISRIKILDEFADVLEIGIPFSDPIADGKIIQNAGQIAINNGFQTSDTFKVISKVNSKKPIVILCYLNTILQYGVEKFMQEASKVNVCTVLCPDLPPKHRDLLAIYARTYGIELTHIISTNTAIDRVKSIDNTVKSFIYLVSKPSITGIQADIPQETLLYIEKIKAFVKNPVYIGFGIANKFQIQQLKTTKIDGFIVGSRIISLATDEISQFLQDLLS